MVRSNNTQGARSQDRTLLARWAPHQLFYVIVSRSLDRYSDVGGQSEGRAHTKIHSRKKDVIIVWQKSATETKNKQARRTAAEPALFLHVRPRGDRWRATSPTTSSMQTSMGSPPCRGSRRRTGLRSSSSHNHRGSRRRPPAEADAATADWATAFPVEAAATTAATTRRTALWA